LCPLAVVISVVAFLLATVEDAAGGDAAELMTST
jgi:hypothetical protein